MFVGTLPPTSNREDWNIIAEVTDDDTEYLLDLSGATIVLEAKDKCGTTVLSATTDNGKITIPDIGVFVAAFTSDEMACLKNDTYAVGCTIFINGGKRQLIIGTQPVLDGVVSR